METEYDRTGEGHAKSDHDAKFDVNEPRVPTGVDNPEPTNHDVSLQPGPDLILDERLTSAAAPFLYMLSIILIAVAGYFVYLFFYW